MYLSSDPANFFFFERFAVLLFYERFAVLLNTAVMYLSSDQAHRLIAVKTGLVQDPALSRPY
jgi:hypothetical protein